MGLIKNRIIARKGLMRQAVAEVKEIVDAMGADHWRLWRRQAYRHIL